MELELKRTYFSETATMGKLSVDGVEFSDTLEDTCRTLPAVCPYTTKWKPCQCKEKVYGQTCIPEGTYEVQMCPSDRYKEMMPTLLNVQHFLGLLIHSGRTVSHTDGCILVGNRHGDTETLDKSSQLFFILKRAINYAFQKGEKITLKISGAANYERKEIEEKPQTPYSVSVFQGLDKSGQQTTLDEFFTYLKTEKQVDQNLTVEDFLKFESKGVSNLTNIVDVYTPAMKEQYKDEIANGKPPYVMKGTSYSLPNANVEVELQKIAGSDLFAKHSDSFSLFWSDAQKALLSDLEYVPWTELTKKNNTDGEGQRDVTQLGELGSDLSPTIAQAKGLNIRVWIYVRAKNALYDISPWIITASTQKTMGVGNFTLNLAPTEDLNLDNYYDNFAHAFPIVNQVNGINRDWFTKYVQLNDVVFIRFERLKLETDDLEGTFSTDSTVPNSKLGTGVVWDMMGLVDTVECDINAEVTDYSVSITGRDLMKLFVEDGSYFIPLKFVQGSKDRWFYGGDPESSWFKRNMISGNYDYYFAYEFQKIKNVVWFVINQLSNIEIVPTELFASCALQKEKLPVEAPDEFQEKNTVEGIWQMVQVWVDDQLEDRRVVDRSLANPEGTLMDLFKKVCQDPFVEFWGDTWINGFDLLIRTPPFTKSAIVDDVLSSGTYVSITNKDIFSLSLSYDDRAYSWYRLMPQNGWTGNSQFSSLAFLPILFFEEFTKIYGNKRCIINDIYISEKSLLGNKSEKGINTLSQMLLNDLLFIVETSAYLPFTRKGTIVINGDRRIKVGTFVRLEATGELFYVTGVNNTITFSNQAVDRVTVLTVERGMLIKYAEEYFKIINLEAIEKAVRVTADKKEGSKDETPAGTGVNTSVFEFFQKRKMFDNQDEEDENRS